MKLSGLVSYRLWVARWVADVVCESNDDRPDCSRCGQWYVGGVKHDCRPEVPVVLSYPIKYWDQAEGVRDDLGLSFDSGSDGVIRDWQFEMLGPADRLKIIGVLKKSKIPFKIVK